MIDHLKKPEMATEAETLLADTGWLPEPLRTPGLAMVLSTEATAGDVEDADVTAGSDADVETAAIGGEPAMDDPVQTGKDDKAEQGAQLTAAE